MSDVKPTTADREKARVLTTYGTGPIAQEEIAQALAEERTKARADAIEAIRHSWDQQCAGYKDMSCESCRAYSDAILSLGGDPS